MNGPFYEFNGTEKLAVRFTAPFSGDVSGAYLTTLINHADVNPIIDGDGDILVSIHNDDGGFPGQQIGSTVSRALNLLDAGTENYINLIATNAAVTSGEIYHIVLALSNSVDVIKVKFDNGANDQIINYSQLYVQGLWRKFGDVFSGAYNLLLKSENITIDYVDAIEETEEIVVSSFSLDQNYPNPFNPTTTIGFTLSKASQTNLTIFDVLGREVAVLTDELRNAGTHTIEWDGKNKNGKQVPTGIYFYRLQTNEGVLSKKMLLVK